MTTASDDEYSAPQRASKYPGLLSWSPSVSVGYGTVGVHTIDGPSEALKFLELRWPAERRDRYAIACSRCCDALEKKCSWQDARDAFVGACLDAGLIS
jgi:hypothetical protein